MRFFVNTGEGIYYYDTQEEAVAAAEQAIKDWKTCCDPEWPEEVEQVCWGAVLGETLAIESGENNEYVDYKLSEHPAMWRCNLCGGLVSFDGTAPAKNTA